MLIDEPFIGLDPHSIRLIKDLLKEKTRNGVTILLTTHILALAEDIADRLGIISRGELIAQGTLAELLRQGTSSRLEDVFLELTGAPNTGPSPS
jgi:ABC-2 type transport system ATP-binding protein